MNQGKLKQKSLLGFTLVELIIVIAVIGGLASVFIVTYPASQRRARDTNRRSEIKQYQTALESYANSHNGFYPTGSGDLDSYCGTLGLSVCPDDADNDYGYLSNADGTFYVIWAMLEQEDDGGNTVYFYSCSNGESGDSVTDPAGISACPNL